MPTLQQKVPALHAYIAYELNTSAAVVLVDHTTEQIESFLWAVFTECVMMTILILLLDPI